MVTIESLRASVGEDNILRHVRLGENGSILLTWDTHQRDSMGKWFVGYAFATNETAFPLFVGSDFACSPLNAVDSDACLRGILTFLTLRPGDTDAEYFEHYTPAQHEYTETQAEYDSLWASDANAPPFIDIDAGEGQAYQPERNDPA